MKKEMFSIVKKQKYLVLWFKTFAKTLVNVVATYHSVGGRREAHGCVFQGRKTRGVATNVYLRKRLEKTKSRSTNFKNKRFWSCFYARRRY